MSSVVSMYGLKELPGEHESTMQVNWLLPKQNIGIEIEVEYGGETDINPDSMTMWAVKSDGSLRNGREFVLDRPMRGDTLSAAIEEFFRHNTVQKSPTSGTHIHVDMRDKESSLDVVKTMASIIVCIEPAIFGMFAAGREWCGYTNPLTTLPMNANFSVFSDKAAADDFRLTFSPSTREYKYYGFNMLPLGRYGSVEFRYFHTAENADELIEWVQFCMAVKQAAVTINTRANLKYYLSSEQGWEEFLSRFFPQWRDRMMAFLPHNQVYLRHKQARSRARTVKEKRVEGGNRPNKLINTRFKKFFAMKMKDVGTGRMKLVYDLQGVASCTPVRLFVRNDPALNSYGYKFNEGDWLVNDDWVYVYNKERGWVEVILYSINPTRIVDSFNTPSPDKLVAFFRLAAARLSGSYSDDQVDLTDPSITPRARLNRLQQVVGLMQRRYGGEQQAQEVSPPELQAEDSPSTTARRVGGVPRIDEVVYIPS